MDSARTAGAPFGRRLDHRGLHNMGGDTRITYILVDGENIDATLGTSIFEHQHD